MFATAGILAALFATGIVLGGAAYADEPCSATKFVFADVQAACAAGGRSAANKLMKGVVKKAKAAGESMSCKSCHTDTKSWELTPNAVDDYRKWTE